jgi:hypothetical protein
LQSGDSGHNRRRAGGGNAPGDAGDLMEAAPPTIGRRSTADGEVERRPGAGLRGGSDTERERGKRGAREERQLTASKMAWSTVAGDARRRRNRRWPAVPASSRVRVWGVTGERRRGESGARV